MTMQARPASAVDQKAALDFLNGSQLEFRHLDWLPAADYLERPGAFVLLNEQGIHAMLSVAPENPQAAWLRFFVSLRDGRHKECFAALLKPAFAWLAEEGIPSLFSLGMTAWMDALLENNGFSEDNRLVTLQRSVGGLPAFFPVEGLITRQMTYRDLTQVAGIDALAFSPEWQVNMEGFERLYHTAGYATVALCDGNIVGYQVSSSIFETSHLARLAVAPGFRGLHIGRTLVSDMLREMSDQGIRNFTVNTQSRNTASLALYQDLGYVMDDLAIPVYRHGL